MAKNSVIWMLFALMAISQLAIPALMIKGQEDTLSYGTEYRFRTRPVDPYDLMRGKYITLQYDEVWAKSASNWNSGDLVFITLSEDEQGFARLEEAFQDRPTSEIDYLEITLDGYHFEERDSIYVRLPFDRFYMEESKAQAAEDLYRESARSEEIDAYAVVMVKEGKAVLKNVMLDGVPIKEAVERMYLDNSTEE